MRRTVPLLAVVGLRVGARSKTPEPEKPETTELPTPAK